MKSLPTQVMGVVIVQWVAIAPHVKSYKRIYIGKLAACPQRQMMLCRLSEFPLIKETCTQYVVGQMACPAANFYPCKFAVSHMIDVINRDYILKWV